MVEKIILTYHFMGLAEAETVSILSLLLFETERWACGCVNTAAHSVLDCFASHFHFMEIKADIESIDVCERPYFLERTSNSPAVFSNHEVVIFANALFFGPHVSPKFLNEPVRIYKPNLNINLIGTENKKRTIIYQWINLINGKTYVGSA